MSEDPRRLVPRTDTLLADPQLTDAEMDAVRDEVFRVLGWE